MKKIAIAASSVALAAMPVVGVFAAVDDVTKSTDTLNVTVNNTCTITSTYDDAAGDGAWGTPSSSTVGSGTAAEHIEETNTWTVAMNNSDSKTSPVHTMAIFCNNTKGWDLSAQNAANLSTGTDTIAYTTSAAKGVIEGYYVNVAATAGSDEGATVSTTNVSNGKMGNLSANAGSIYSKAVTTGEGAHSGSTSTASLDVSYTVATIDTTEAGTYTGTVVYTLAPKTE